MKDLIIDNDESADFYVFGPRKAKILEFERPEGYMSYYYDHMFKYKRTMNYMKEQSIKLRLERDIRNKEFKKEQITVKSMINYLNDSKNVETQAVRTQLKTLSPSLSKVDVSEKSAMSNQIVVEIKPISIITVRSEFETKIESKQPHLPVSLTLLDIILLDLFFTKKSCKQVVLALPAPETVSQDHVIDLRAKEMFDKKDNPDSNKHEINAGSQDLILQSTEILNIKSEQNYSLHETELEQCETACYLTETPTEVIAFKPSSNETAADLLKSNFMSQEKFNGPVDLSSSLLETEFKPHEIVLQDKDKLNRPVNLDFILLGTEPSAKEKVLKDKEKLSTAKELDFYLLETEPNPNEMVLQDKEMLNYHFDLIPSLLETEPSKNKMVSQDKEFFYDQINLNSTLIKKEAETHEMGLREKETLNDQIDLNLILLESRPDLNELGLRKETLNAHLDLGYILPRTESQQHEMMSNLHSNASTSLIQTSTSPNSSSAQPIPSLVSDETELTQSRQEDDSPNSVPIICERMFNFKNIKSFWEEKSKRK